MYWLFRIKNYGTGKQKYDYHCGLLGPKCSILRRNKYLLVDAGKVPVVGHSVLIQKPIRGTEKQSHWLTQPILEILHQFDLRSRHTVVFRTEDFFYEWRRYR